MNLSLKLLLLATILFLITFGIKIVSKPDPEIKSFKTAIEGLRSHSVVFVGSSRIQLGVDDSLLNQKSPNYEFTNMGVSGNTFLSTYILAQYVIEKTETKIILVEMSPITETFSPFFISAINSMDVPVNDAFHLASNNKIDYFRRNITYRNLVWFERISLKKDVKFLMTSNKHTKPNFGYSPNVGNYAIDASSVLNQVDFNHFLTDPPIHGSIPKLIERLVALGNKNHKKVIFMLPMTYSKNAEKEIVIPIFNQIPVKNKIIPDSILFSRIKNRELLFDMNHFNIDGAHVYTNELLRLMKDQGIIEPQVP